MGVDPPDRTNIPGKRRTRSQGSSKERCLIFADMSINGLFCCGKTHIEMKDADVWILISSWSKWCLLSTRQKSINKKRQNGMNICWDSKFFCLPKGLSFFFLFSVPKRKGFPREALGGAYVDEYDHCFSTSLKNVQNGRGEISIPGQKTNDLWTFCKLFPTDWYIYFHILLGFASQ